MRFLHSDSTLYVKVNNSCQEGKNYGIISVLVLKKRICL